MAQFAVTVDHSEVAGDLTDFPLLVDLADMPAGFWAAVSDGGGDIRCTVDGDPVPREVVSCDVTAESGELWVLVPELSSTADTVVVVEVDGARSEPDADDTYGSEAVWVNGYEAVYHLDAIVDDDWVLDSTGNRHHAESGHARASPSMQPGVIGGGIRPTISRSRRGFGAETNTALSEWTMQAWIEPVDDTRDLRFATMEIAESSTRFPTIGTDKERIRHYRPFSSQCLAPGVITPGVWAFGAVTSDRDDTVVVYHNSDSEQYPDYRPSAVTATRFGISWGDSNVRSFHGVVDEVRFSSVARSPDWIVTEYRNQSNPATFYTIADAEPHDPETQARWIGRTDWDAGLTAPTYAQTRWTGQGHLDATVDTPYISARWTGQGRLDGTAKPDPYLQANWEGRTDWTADARTLPPPNPILSTRWTGQGRLTPRLHARPYLSTRWTGQGRLRFPDIGDELHTNWTGIGRLRADPSITHHLETDWTGKGRFAGDARTAHHLHADWTGGTGWEAPLKATAYVAADWVGPGTFTADLALESIYLGADWVGRGVTEFGWPPVPDPDQPQELLLPPIVDIPTMGRPRLRDEATPAEPVELRGYKPDGTPIAMPDTWNRQFTAELNGAGSGQFDVDYDDRHLFDAGDRIQFLIGGEVAFVLLVEGGPFTELASSEDAGRVQTIEGRGIAGAADQIVIYPEGRVEAKPILMDRPFDWTSKFFDDSGWMEHGGMHVPREEWIDAWRDPADNNEPAFLPPAAVRWAAEGTKWWAPLGHSYFRWLIDTEQLEQDHPRWSGEAAQLWVWGDDETDVFLDSVQLGTVKVGRQPTRFDVDIDPGLHIVAFHVENRPPGKHYPDLDWVAVDPWSHTVQPGETMRSIARAEYGSEDYWRTIYNANRSTIISDATARGEWDPARPWAHVYPGQVLHVPGTTRGAGSGDPRGNPAGVSWLLVLPNSDRRIADEDLDVDGIYDQASYAILDSSDRRPRWLGYPAFSPGMTPGEACWQIGRDYIYRYQTNPPVRISSDLVEVDSAGRAWTQPGALSTKVGTSLLTFLGELSSEYVDWWVSPTGRLELWAKGTMGDDTGVLIEPADEPTDATVEALSGTWDAARKTSTLLVNSAAGWMSVERPDPYPSQATLGLGALRDPAEVRRLAESQLDIYDRDREELNVAVVPTGEGDMPMIAYREGDWVRLRRSDGTVSDERVMAVSMSEDANGQITWMVTLRDRIADADERFANALRKMSNGTVGGDSRVAQPLWPSIPPPQAALVRSSGPPPN